MRPALTLRVTALGAAAGLALTGVVPGMTAAQAASGSTVERIQRVTIPATTDQVIVVRAKTWSTSYATLEAFARRDDGSWRRTMSVPARVGYSGMRPRATRRQGSGETPAGRFTVTRAFGLKADPGTRLPYRHADRNDYWVYDPADARTYNMWQPFRTAKSRWRTSAAERIRDYTTQYRYGAILDYNMPKRLTWSRTNHQWQAGRTADTRKGGGIFLHVNGSDATAGCVSVDEASVKRLLRWMRPGRHPAIVTGKSSWLFSR